MKTNAYTGRWGLAALLAASCTVSACGDDGADPSTAAAGRGDGVNAAADGGGAAVGGDAGLSPGGALQLRYGARGPHAVGFKQLQQQRADGSELEVDVWYPSGAEGSGGQEPSIEYSIAFKSEVFSGAPSPMVLGKAERGALPLSERLPVVLFSHGYGLSPEWYSSLLEHLASHGFYVVAPEHDDGEWMEGVVQATFDRPVDVSSALDFLEKEQLGGRIGTELALDSVALVGHSYGGYTALAAAGARISPRPFLQECAELEATDPRQFLCLPFMAEGALVDAAGLEEFPEGLWPELRDERITAIVPIAGDAFLFGAEGLGPVEVPTLAVGGTADTGTPFEWGAQMTFDEVDSSDAILLGLEQGEHMLPLNSCADMPWTAELSEEMQALFCQDPAWDKERGLQVIGHYTTAFLRGRLAEAGEVEALSTALSVELAQEVGGLLFERR